LVIDIFEVVVLRFLVHADWAFGLFWAVVTGALYVLASVFVLDQALDKSFITSNLLIWTVGGVFVSIAIGWRNKRHL